ncbi:DUF6421 family protein [Amnibacterium sp. CER49]|uniref:DUF6421 family protein n=1 Tax=Amnibacterium sp. CER49 TaxID=3039161 RepID=UPI0024498AE9|nr:DUF6421 family protein [Amnibacterium sp. CER49]MDH2443691.1 DUF6421 family protein [Amnibacterium sp. CER49]
MSLLETTHTEVGATTPTWLALKEAVTAFRPLQQRDGALIDGADRDEAGRLIERVREAVRELAPAFPADTAYLEALDVDLADWAASGFDVPDFARSLAAFNPQRDRVDGLRHLVVFPMTTQNGSPDRLLEAVLIDVVWPEFVDRLERERYSNPLFVPIRFVDFTGGYDTNAAVLFPETVAMKELIPFTWGAIFADREAARYRRVVKAAVDITKLEPTDEIRRLLEDQRLTEETFVLWDLIHDRTHMRGDLPFDPFMIKQRMPYFLYSLEELRCDLTAYREAVRLARDEEVDEVTRDRARLGQVAILFDRLFRFPLTGGRVRNYDGLGGQLLFAWLHQHDVLHWTDTQLAFDWERVPDVVVSLSDEINTLYWASIDRPKIAHWLAAYDLVRSVVPPHPASRWARGLPDEVLLGAPKGMTDAVLDDEFPLSMFYEALGKKLRPTIDSTAGITGETA